VAPSIRGARATPRWSAKIGGGGRLGHASGGWRVRDADASEDRFSHLIKRKLRCSHRSRHAHTMLVVDGLLAELAHRAVGTGYACARRVTRQATRHPETPHRKAGGIPSEHVRCPVIRRWPARDGIDMSCMCAGSTRPRSVCHLQASSRQHPTRKIKLVPLSYGPTLINRWSSARARIVSRPWRSTVRSCRRRHLSIYEPWILPRSPRSTNCPQLEC